MKAVLLEGNALNPGDISWSPIEEVAETVIYGSTTEEEMWDRLGDADIVYVNKLPITEAVLERFPNIRYIGECATGYNNIDIEAAAKRGIPVTNVPAYSTASVVQHTMAFILDMASRITEHVNSVAAGDWCRSSQFCYWLNAPMELEGKTLGIYGFGNIGRGVAKAAEVFGMKVLVYTAHPDKYREYESENLRLVSEDELYREADIITYHCPLTPATTGIVNNETMAKMKDGVFIVNAARGGVVNEAELAAALKSGKVAGYASDAAIKEPINADCPLLDAPNVYFTPHIAWASTEARKRLLSVMGSNAAAWIAGNPVNVVNGVK
ncbi:MAG: D-2-hydroxyacid dehydrogenase [Lachnospiraceae bacterium]|nr:D-2-hydroxyacid dehydrogenase [Lachnospiraceae bacterium]